MVSAPVASGLSVLAWTFTARDLINGAREQYAGTT
jgi:hypothetical protein